MTSPEVKVDADPKFELGSVTKGLTGMLLADAIGRGELTLQTTAGEILADRPELHEQTQGPLHTITLRELCTHTSGLPRLPRTTGTVGRLVRFALLGLDPYRGQSAERVIQHAAGQALQHRGSIATPTSAAPSPVSCWRSPPAPSTPRCCTNGSFSRCR